jgi:hypothetical protein
MSEPFLNITNSEWPLDRQSHAFVPARWEKAQHRVQKIIFEIFKSYFISESR